MRSVLVFSLCDGCTDFCKDDKLLGLNPEGCLAEKYFCCARREGCRLKMLEKLKKTQKQSVDINLNTMIEFVPTEYGRGILDMTGIPFKETSDGKYKMQLWEFMNIFGPNLSLTKPVPCKNCKITILNKD